VACFQSLTLDSFDFGVSAALNPEERRGETNFWRGLFIALRKHVFVVGVSDDEMKLSFAPERFERFAINNERS
jgi:hypothetical protein